MPTQELLRGRSAPIGLVIGQWQQKLQGEYEQWKSTGIEEKDWAIFGDGIYVKAGIARRRPRYWW